MTTTANTGDPLGHPGFVREEEKEEEEAVGEESYESGSDDDDDVDRYVFLARQPAPAAEASDDDDGPMPGGGGGCGRKRHLSTILSHAPPAVKKARFGLAVPSGASAEDFGSEEPVRSAERFRGDLDQGNKKNKKRRRCGGEPLVHSAARGKRSRIVDIEASRHRDVTAGQKTLLAAEALAGAPRRFVCSLCGKCFGSHQALGGHVHLGHTKKAKKAIAAATHGDSEEKAAVAASPGESDGDGKKIITAVACHQDFDSSSGDSDKEEMHGDHRGDGYVEGEKATVAASRDATDGTKSKFAVERCHELAATGIGNANSIVRKTQYRCEVCGKECLSGQALGGHMRKHRKLSPHNGGKERRSPEVAIGAGHGKEKTAVAASPGESNGDIDSSDSDSNDEEMFIGAARHGDADSNGNGTERKIAIGRCHELAAIANANSSVRKMQYRCEVCGKECHSGQALGGHMRKHRKLPPHNGAKERISPEVADDAGRGQEKTAVVASSGESDGDGKKIISPAACHQDVDSSSGDSNSNDGMFIDAANHRGNGHAVEGEKVTIAASRNDAHGNGNDNGIAGIGNVNSIVRKTHHKCEVRGKECFSGQALGGHMRKHRKLSPQIGGKEPDGAGHGQHKTAVAASPGEPDGYAKKSFHAAAYHQDVDSSSGDSDSDEDEMFIGAAKHGDADGHGNSTERKVSGAIGNANSVVRKTLQYRCEMCGKEYLSGQALGGHMRKHRKLSPHDGGEERRSSPEVNGMPNQRPAVITGNRQLSKTTNSPFDGSLIGWL